jgi:hypothetical protein
MIADHLIRMENACTNFGEDAKTRKREICRLLLLYRLAVVLIAEWIVQTCPGFRDTLTTAATARTLESGDFTSAPDAEAL